MPLGQRAIVVTALTSGASRQFHAPFLQSQYLVLAEPQPAEALIQYHFDLEELELGTVVILRFRDTAARCPADQRVNLAT